MCSCGGRYKNSAKSENKFSNLSDATLRKKLEDAKKAEKYEKASKIHDEMIARGLLEVMELQINL